jgi:hypothetical protein
MDNLIIFLEVLIILLSIILVLYLNKKNNKTIKRYILIFLGVLIFEFFTQPLWKNLNLGPYAYIYQDVSWVLTLGWSTIVLISFFIIDKKTRLRETKKFFLYVLLSSIIGIIAETIVLKLGIRDYSPEVKALLKGVNIPFTNVPIEALYYIPVFMSLIIGFVRYFELSFSKELKAIDSIPLLIENKKSRKRKKIRK